MAREKIVFEYDTNDGMMYDAEGVSTGFFLGLPLLWTPYSLEEAKPFQMIEEKSGVNDLIKLKESGFTVEDILQLRSEHLI